MLARLNKNAFDLGTLIINGNNIPLKGTLSKAFYGTMCEKLIFKNFDAQNIQDLRQAFENSAFSYIDFTEFKVGNRVNMESMLCGCINLESVDLQPYRQKKCFWVSSIKEHKATINKFIEHRKIVT